MRVIHNEQVIHVCDFCGISNPDISLHIASYTHAAICENCMKHPSGLYTYKKVDAPESKREAG